MPADRKFSSTRSHVTNDQRQLMSRVAEQFSRQSIESSSVLRNVLLDAVLSRTPVAGEPLRRARRELLQLKWRSGK